MIYLLDSNAISDAMTPHASMLARMGAVRPSDRVVTSVTVRGEILWGIERLAHGRKREALERNATAVFALIPVEPVPVGAAEHYARAKLTCRARGIAMSENDLWIAASALAMDATLVTDDGDFSALPGLRIENWRA